MNETVIRPYSPRDRQAVREIAWDTAFLGHSGGAFFTDKPLLQDFLTAYFTDYEPQSCFVAESSGEVVGYLLGAVDERRMGEACRGRLAWSLLARFLLCDVFRPKNIIFVLRMIRSWARGEFRGEQFYPEYPAILHINLKEGFRGNGTGGRLIAAYLAYLKAGNVPAVRLATMTAKGAAFFEKQGFVLLSRHTRSYFRALTGAETVVSIYGKKIL